MEWIKKNLVWVVGGILLTAIILYLKAKSDKKELSKDAGRGIQKGKLTPQEEKDMAELKKKLDACEEQAKTIKWAAGAPHPCVSLRDAYAVFTKKQESSYAGGYLESSYGCGNESGYGCGSESSYGQFAGAFDKTEGLNLTDFAMGMQGTALYEDKQL